jgi:hypothetical protein
VTTEVPAKNEIDKAVADIARIQNLDINKVQLT